MQPLRSARFLARLVLAWFVLVVAAAAATPALQPKSLELVCSGGGMKLVAMGDDAAQPQKVASLDCPLCLAIAPPPPRVVLPAQPPLAPALQSIPSARVAALTAAPPPARGPPSSIG